MIKCNVTIIGTISRNGEIKTDREGRPFLTFGLQTVITDKSGARKTLDISVAKDGNNEPAFDFAQGARVKVSGTLSFRKRDDFTYYNLSAKSVDFNISEADGISGTMSFRGTLGSKEVMEKRGKKGDFRLFDAYSSEKIDEGKYAYIWVHFVDFNESRPDWLAPKCAIEAEGELEFSLYNDKEQINCRVSSLSQWEKRNAYQ